MQGLSLNKLTCRELFGRKRVVKSIIFAIILAFRAGIIMSKQQEITQNTGELFEAEQPPKKVSCLPGRGLYSRRAVSPFNG